MCITSSNIFTPTNVSSLASTGHVSNKHVAHLLFTRLSTVPTSFTFKTMVSTVPPWCGHATYPSCPPNVLPHPPSSTCMEGLAFTSCMDRSSRQVLFTCMVSTLASCMVIQDHFSSSIYVTTSTPVFPWMVCAYFSHPSSTSSRSIGLPLSIPSFAIMDFPRLASSSASISTVLDLGAVG
ncbi:hypothetical protein HMI54_008685 [Coelomomyces lativittatus]|nr:hypothetical protein HMI54_008685 [Coelomomyces lativittatus]